MPNDSNPPGVGLPRQPSQAGDLDRLLRQLRDFSDQARETAAVELGRLRDQRAVTALLGRLTNDKSPRVRLGAGEALFQIGDAQAWPEIESTLSEDPEPLVRVKMAEILGQMGDKSRAPKLVNALRDWSPEVKAQAAKALGLLKNAEVIGSIIAGLHLQDGSLKDKECGPYIQALALMGPMVAESVLSSAVFQGSANEDGHSKTVFASGGYWPKDGEYRPGWARSSVSYIEPESFLRDRSIVLSKLGSSILTLLERHVKPPAKPEVRIVVLQALKEINDNHAVRLMCQTAVQDPVPAIRWLSVHGIGSNPVSMSNSALVLDSLTQVLQKDSDWIVRRRAAQAIGDLQVVQGLDRLANAALKDVQIEVRREAIVSLSKLRDPRAIPTLGSIVLDSPDVDSRRLATDAMGQIGSADGLDYLLSALGGDGDVRVRVASATAMGKIGDRRAKEPLKTVMNGGDADSSVREAAKAALALIK